MIALEQTAALTRARLVLSPEVARAVLLLLIAASIAAGLLVDDATVSRQAISAAGADLTRLLRMMAMLKAGLALAACAAVFWRLATVVTPVRLAAYAVACGAMAAGPVLIWNMAHVVGGAVLLHGGLASAIMLVWRDPAVADRLAAMSAARQQGGRARSFAGRSNAV